MLKTLAKVRQIGSLLWHVDPEKIRLRLQTEEFDSGSGPKLIVTATPIIDGIDIDADRSRRFAHGGWAGQGGSVEEALETLLIVLAARCRDYEKDLAAFNEECKKCGSTAIFGCLVTCAL